MTRDQIVAYVCSKVVQFDATSLAFCADVVNRRYQMISDADDWLDLMIDDVVTVTAGTSVYTVPATIERITKIATSTGSTIEPVEFEFLIDTYPELISGSGAPRFYVEFRSVAGLHEFQLYPSPNTALTLRPYGKRIFAALGASDSPLIRNIDNCLIAFVQADMLQRQHQYGKAAQLVEEAGSLLKQAQAVEKERANRPRTSRALTVDGDSLSEMADAVCCRIGDYSPPTQVMVKELLRRNYLDVYDSQLWPELSVIARMDRDGSEIVLPEYFDRVVSVRANVGLSQINVAQGNYIFGIDPRIFERSGTAVAFQMLTSVGVAVLPPINEPLSFVSTSDADMGQEMVVRGESQGTEIFETVVLNGTVPVISGYPYDTPITVAKPPTTGTVTVSGAESAAFLQQLEPGDREKRHLRLWLQPTPVATDTDKALIMGKRKCKPLAHDNDTPILRGIGNLLIALSAGDMFAKIGNKDMAMEMTRKAGIAMKTLVDREITQNAFAQVAIPYAEGCVGSYYDSYNPI